MSNFVGAMWRNRLYGERNGRIGGWTVVMRWVHVGVLGSVTVYRLPIRLPANSALT